MNTSAQAQIHKRNAVWKMLQDNGAKQGVSPALRKHAFAWHTLGDEAPLPQKWTGKMQEVFEQLIPESEMQALDSSVASYIASDDSELRRYVSDRVVVEIGIAPVTSDFGRTDWRSRKFSDPLYLTPAGFLHAYPETDEDLFIDHDQAQTALGFYRNTAEGIRLAKNTQFRILAPAVLGKIGGPGYLRWVKEVKGKAYTEPRRTLAETHEIYSSGGRAALKAIYSPSYVYVLLRTFAQQGLKLAQEDKT